MDRGFAAQRAVEREYNSGAKRGDRQGESY